MIGRYKYMKIWRKEIWGTAQKKTENRLEVENRTRKSSRKKNSEGDGKGAGRGNWQTVEQNRRCLGESVVPIWTWVGLTLSSWGGWYNRHWKGEGAQIVGGAFVWVSWKEYGFYVGLLKKDKRKGKFKREKDRNGRIAREDGKIARRA